jgi:hypothetical protein
LRIARAMCGSEELIAKPKISLTQLVRYFWPLDKVDLGITQASVKVEAPSSCPTPPVPEMNIFAVFLETLRRQRT